MSHQRAKWHDLSSKTKKTVKPVKKTKKADPRGKKKSK